MRKRVPHTWRFYRKRYRGFCRRMVWLLSLLELGMAGGIDQGSLNAGPTLLKMALVAGIIYYCWGVAYGYGKEGGACDGTAV